MTNTTGIALIAAAVLASFLAAFAYAKAVEVLTGHELNSPPYLMARVIADGPGRRLIEEKCTPSSSPYAVCAWAGQPFRDHNDFLWGAGGARMNFAGASPEMREALKAEQYAFVLDAAASYPLGQLQASIGNGVAQFFQLGIGEIAFGAARLLHEPVTQERLALDVLPGFEGCLADPASCPPEPVGANIWDAIVASANLLLTIGFFAVLACWATLRLSSYGAANARYDRLLGIGLLIAAALIVNAFLCGALSGPHDRYQARLIWLAGLYLALAAPVIIGLVAHLGRRLVQA
ncbi:MAG: hypothetical protein HC850_11345 [Rhodomicrobium sp.]|nr:hypothetical protein [Rhodomicrobium sp.]